MAETALALPADDYGMWKNRMFAQADRETQGMGYALEALRLGFQEGKVGYREALAVRTVGQPGVAGHTDTSPPTK